MYPEIPLALLDHKFSEMLQIVLEVLQKNDFFCTDNKGEKDNQHISDFHIF